MRTNKSLLSKKRRIKKALVSMPGMVLLPEDADKFLDYVIDESVLKHNARIVKMARSSRNIRAIGLGAGRVLFPAATFKQDDYKQKFGHNLITLQTTKFRGCVVIHDDDLDEVAYIESDNEFTDHLLRMVAADIANDLEEFYWIADTHNVGGFPANDIRSTRDGWRYILTHAQEGEQYYNDVSGAPVLLDATSAFKYAGKIVEQNPAEPFDYEFKYSKAKRNLPSKYKKGGLKNLRFIGSDQVQDDFNEALADRGTVLGDRALLGQEEGVYGSIKIAPIPLMPIDLDANGKLGAGDYTDTLLTHYLNLIIGMQRDVKIETEREAADEANYFYYSMKTTMDIENVAAAVLIHKLTTGK